MERRPPFVIFFQSNGSERLRCDYRLWTILWASYSAPLAGDTVVLCAETAERALELHASVVDGRFHEDPRSGIEFVGYADGESRWQRPGMPALRMRSVGLADLQPGNWESVIVADVPESRAPGWLLEAQREHLQRAMEAQQKKRPILDA